MFPDSDARYEDVWDVDLNALKPQIARPHRVDDVVSIDRLGDVAINQAYLGSCTNGRMEDLRAAAGILNNKKVHRKVRLLVTPASYEIYKEAMKEGVLETLIDAGAIINHPGCGACFGAHMGLLAPGDVCVSTTNRNFVGRMGSPEASIYLANPYVVAASAIAGKIVHPDAV